MYEWRRDVVPVPPKREGPLNGFLHGPGGRVTGIVLTVPERYCPGHTVGEHRASGGP